MSIITQPFYVQILIIVIIIIVVVIDVINVIIDIIQLIIDVVKFVINVIKFVIEFISGKKVFPGTADCPQSISLLSWQGKGSCTCFRCCCKLWQHKGTASK